MYSIEQASLYRLPRLSIYYLVYKRVLDLVLGMVGLLFSLPIILFFSLLIRLETPGSPIYVQERLGKNGKIFKIIKLRSMRSDAEKEGARWAASNDCRVTRIGKFIRKTRIDELPQFFLIIKGDMSIVGPRPERPMFTEQFAREISGFENRLLVKPGLTGLAQVRGGYDISPEEKFKHDMEYIKHVSFLLDLKIIIRTFSVIITGEGAR
ncbi:sugar transferase [Pullulanibacillus sp. KACC 23026]|uniref:sugar transferase n=1 Tax=Pullulanibacillus sp. KACC 23026 TaxID=3028315 RepID=UPI0023AF5ED9|nr:sugar transferase [Pullulanibacillus sp. KACC 23026]WEG12634.1 sugar transferase [Pullulanibacillus sp. KACC 23026]